VIPARAASAARPQSAPAPGARRPGVPGTTVQPPELRLAVGAGLAPGVPEAVGAVGAGAAPASAGVKGTTGGDGVGGAGVTGDGIGASGTGIPASVSGLIEGRSAIPASRRGDVPVSRKASTAPPAEASLVAGGLVVPALFGGSGIPPGGAGLPPGAHLISLVGFGVSGAGRCGFTPAGHSAPAAVSRSGGSAPSQTTTRVYSGPGRCGKPW
jgi:hypothetical protein